ncbi:EscU/YscU/HrcU family type III secretion system export apparatus switch protein [Salipiger bermudensis]|uniref:EscU/YscU/HrcU family type III secretion system export apparatus switch protein n=1 Tax=Salipiger bermudensis TaxID=344736 RepID=UPI001CD22761|nr:flagellar type III secretion system protein FlhB [Salipiger bermudensis]MCA1287671.1 flagellar type III secretion system protein FlhB [Salipiger bermudensis]
MADQDEDKDNKTEEPTERKLRKSREKGDVASSKEAGNVMAVLSLFAITAFVLPSVSAPLAGVFRNVLESAGQVHVGTDLSGLRDLGAVSWKVLRGVGILLGPLMALMVIGALAGVALQGEVVVASERLKPKWSKISPISGFKRLFSLAAFVEFFKSVTKVLLVGVIAGWVVLNAVGQIWQTQGLVPEMVTDFIRAEAARMLLITLALVSVIAVADILWKRFDHRRKQRMSMKEIKDEVKETEGDPLIRSKRMNIRRERARQRLAQAVPRATVVLTNPTHFAVALKYENGVDMAPVCVAKGADLLAARIRELAKENEIPMVENRPLARALHDVAELDRPIPVEHWEAVAAIIGYIMDLERNIRRTPPEGSSLREEA